jgi:hypothetical protein
MKQDALMQVLGIFLALHLEKCITHLEYYVGGANVFQKEKEKEKETAKGDEGLEPP